MNNQFQGERFAGWSALASGVLGILAVLSLIAFYTFQVPRMLAENDLAAPGGFNLGLLNDLLTLAAGFFLLLLVLLFPGAAAKASPAQLAATLSGLAGATGILLTMLAFLLGRISLLQQAVFYALAFGPLGVWHLAVNTAGVGRWLFSARLARFGQIVGLGEVAAFAAFNLFGGWTILATTDFAALLTNYPLILGTLVGGLTGYIGGPLWAIGLGRALLAKVADRDRPPDPTA